VTLLLQDEEWAAWSDREIARRCCVGKSFVSTVRASILATVDSMPAVRTFTHHKTGTEATMRTENIGKPVAADHPVVRMWRASTMQRFF
jgi:hypothetical protein